MINIENLLNAPLLSDPWDHQIIDDFLDKETFEAACDIARKIAQLDDLEGAEILWMNDLLEIGATQQQIDLIVDSADQMMKYVNEISAPYKNRLESKLGYFNNPRFGVSIPHAVGDIHDEGTNKVMALIIYLEPEQSFGTKLYREDNTNTLATEVEWKPNRAFLMFSQPCVTWHKFDALDKPRITLNFYFEKQEALEHLNADVDPERIAWLYEQFGNDKLLVNL